LQSCHNTMTRLLISWWLLLQFSPSDPENGTNNRMMRDLGAQYRDEYDTLQTNRHLRQKHDIEPALRLTGREKSFNFVVCSAKLANTGHSRFVQIFGAFAFFDLRDVFEMTLEHYREEHLDLIHQDIVSLVQARSPDAETACQWIIHGGVAMLTMNNEVMKGFESGAGEPTDYWEGTEGVSEARWALWHTRMGAIESEDLSESAKEALRRTKSLINHVAVD
jgi:hypothetical protein